MFHTHANSVLRFIAVLYSLYMAGVPIMKSVKTFVTSSTNGYAQVQSSILVLTLTKL